MMMRLRCCAFGGAVLCSFFFAFQPFHICPLSSSGAAGFHAGIGLAYAEEQGYASSVTNFQVEPLYQAAKLSWKARISGDGQVTFEIYRSMANPEGPYTLVATMEGSPDKKKYQYVDKQLPVEENYFYKIEIPSTKESFGPLQVRPPFTLPST